MGEKKDFGAPTVLGRYLEIDRYLEIEKDRIFKMLCYGIFRRDSKNAFICL